MSSSHSIYNKGANDGWKMGIYLTAMFLTQAASIYNPALSLIGAIMMIGIPFVAYILLRRAYVESNGANTFSAVWLQGIIFFLCGGLIMSAVSYLYMRFINPEFIVDFIHFTANTYRTLGTGESMQFADQLDRLVDKHLVPSSIQMAFSFIWVYGFLGSLLSLLLTCIVKAIPVRRK